MYNTLQYLLCDMIWIMPSLSDWILPDHELQTSSNPPSVQIFAHRSRWRNDWPYKHCSFWDQSNSFHAGHPNASQNDDIWIHCTLYDMLKTGAKTGTIWVTLGFAPFVISLLWSQLLWWFTEIRTKRLTCRMDSEWIFYLLHSFTRRQNQACKSLLPLYTILPACVHDCLQTWGQLYDGLGSGLPNTATIRRWFYDLFQYQHQNIIVLLKLILQCSCAWIHGCVASSVQTATTCNY